MCRKNFGIVIISIAMAFMLLSVYFFANYKIIMVSGDSMAPNYHNGQLLIASRSVSSIVRSDIVVAEVPEYGVVIKRVAAVSGDTVDMSGEKLKINDLILSNYKSFHVHHSSGICTLTDSEIYVLGDNYNDSIDSRVFGAVQIKNVLGVIHE